ncbi:MAG: RecQ family ATP-dependent DNA helicase [Phycisphaerales bacterium]|nr:MAG: RecQ family ATP-dependent DNA helicase [Phycisphaerales bacterium]
MKRAALGPLTLCPVTTAPDNSLILDAVRRVWGFDDLRPLQARAIELAVAGRDGLVVLPTGGGKSLCYQAPPLVTGRLTVVLSPLIALMRDQVRGLELNGYPAAALHSGLDAEEARATVARLRAGELKLILCAPERAVNPGFKSLLAELADSGRLGAIAIDEAHCISQWGHDFRPEYRRLRELREVAPGVGMQAFTATATPRVREDIVRQLGLRDEHGALVVPMVGDFDRPNLTYRVRARRGDGAEQASEAIGAMHERGEGGAIVYCMSRAKTEELAGKLRAAGHDAEAYHAGLNPDKRHGVERRFTNEQLDVVCATVAFGMGIDRSNVRLVAHANLPKSVEAYQQEAGRAGRDGLEAECLLLTAPGDSVRWRQLIERSAGETGASDDSTAAQIELLNEMQRFAGTLVCRHKALCEHFGQAFTKESCGACDVCLGETESEPDGQRIAQMILSGVARTGQSYGAGHVVDVLRGSGSEKIGRAGHDRLSVFGLMKDRRKAEVMAFVDQLVAAGALEVGEFRTLRFGARGAAVMRGEETVRLGLPMGTRSAGSERPERRSRASSELEARPLSVEEKRLFESLRALRKSIAEELGAPPYVVFSDATLRELARSRPADTRAMLRVKGVGPAKLEQFGEAFLAAIASG